MLYFGFCRRCFIKPHRSFLVNMQYVNTIENHQITLQTLSSNLILSAFAAKTKQGSILLTVDAKLSDLLPISDIRNSYQAEPVIRQGLPVSKEQGHGFGTKSMAVCINFRLRITGLSFRLLSNLKIIRGVFMEIKAITHQDKELWERTAQFAEDCSWQLTGKVL